METKIEELKDETFYALFAPDGSWQCMTTAPDFETCVAVIKMLHKAGMGKSFHELVKIQGCLILPVKISLVQDGNENKPFAHKLN